MMCECCFALKAGDICYSVCERGEMEGFIYLLFYMRESLDVSGRETKRSEVLNEDAIYIFNLQI